MVPVNSLTCIIFHEICATSYYSTLDNKQWFVLTAHCIEDSSCLKAAFSVDFALTVMFQNKIILTFQWWVWGLAVLQEGHYWHQHGGAIELPSPSGLCCLLQMGSMSVENEAGWLHHCYNGPYLTEGLVLSRAKTPFSLSQLGGLYKLPCDALAFWSLDKWNGGSNFMFSLGHIWN